MKELKDRIFHAESSGHHWIMDIRLSLEQKRILCACRFGILDGGGGSFDINWTWENLKMLEKT